MQRLLRAACLFWQAQQCICICNCARIRICACLRVCICASIQWDRQFHFIYILCVAFLRSFPFSAQKIHTRCCCCSKWAKTYLLLHPVATAAANFCVFSQKAQNKSRPSVRLSVPSPTTTTTTTILNQLLCAASCILYLTDTHSTCDLRLCWDFALFVLRFCISFGNARRCSSLCHGICICIS